VDRFALVKSGKYSFMAGGAGAPVREVVYSHLLAETERTSIRGGMFVNNLLQPSPTMA